jgi:hypothetical protein
MPFAKAMADRSSRSSRYWPITGHPLDLDKLQAGEMLDAMIASFGGDENKLAAIVERPTG